MNESEEYFDYSTIVRSVERRWYYLVLGLAVGAALSVFLAYNQAPRSVEINLLLGKLYSGDVAKGSVSIDEPGPLRERIISTIHPRVFAKHYGLSLEEVNRRSLRDHITVSIARTPGVVNIHIHEKTFDDAIAIANEIGDQVRAEHQRQLDNVLQFIRRDVQVSKERMKSLESGLEQMDRYLKQEQAPEGRMKLADVFILERIQDKRQMLQGLREKVWGNELAILLSHPSRVIEERPTRIFAPYVLRALYGAVAGLGLALLVVLWLGRAETVAVSSPVQSSSPAGSILEDTKRRTS